MSQNLVFHAALIVVCHFWLPEPVGLAIHMAFALLWLFHFLERRFRKQERRGPGR